MKLKDKIAVVTGSGRGIGKGIALTFGREGATVVVCSRTEKEMNRTVDEIRDMGGEAIGISVDVTKEVEVENLVKKVVEAYGRIDILVNNAGTTDPAFIDEMEESRWDKVLDTNLKGVFLCTKHILRVMKPNRSGKIITIASDSGKSGTSEDSAYCSSKFGVLGFMESLTKEVLEYDISVSSILPGWVNTELSKEVYSDEELAEKGMPPMSEWIQPEQIGELAVFLANVPNSLNIQELMVLSTAEILYMKPILDEV